MFKSHLDGSCRLVETKNCPKTSLPIFLRAFRKVCRATLNMPWEVLERYAEHGITVFRTDEQGTMEFSTNGEHLWVEMG